MKPLHGRLAFGVLLWLSATCAMHYLGWPHLHAVETCSWVCLLMLATTGIFVAWATHLLAPTKC